ncbi:MAG: hypothetical protein ACLTMP_11075 [Eggerthella lenta]
MAKKKKQASNMLEVQNAAKTLFANIRFMSPDNPIRSIVMTSSVPNEGKSTCSWSWLAPSPRRARRCCSWRPTCAVARLPAC